MNDPGLAEHVLELSHGKSRPSGRSQVSHCLRGGYTQEGRGWVNWRSKCQHELMFSFIPIQMVTHRNIR